MSNSSTATSTSAASASTGAASTSAAATVADITAAAGTRRNRARTALITLQIVLALFYAVASAMPKLLGVDAAVDAFDEIGFGHWFMYVIGSLELAGAVALVIPVLYQIAATCLIGLMVGATVTQITVFDGDGVVTPIVLIIPLALIAWARRDSTPALVALLRDLR